MWNCFECKNPIDEQNRENIVWLPKPSRYLIWEKRESLSATIPFERLFYHKQCALIDENAKKIKELASHSGIVAHILRFCEIEGKTYRETLEMLVIELANQNTRYFEAELAYRMRMPATSVLVVTENEEITETQSDKTIKEVLNSLES